MNDYPEPRGVLHLLLTAEKEHWRDCLRCCKATDTVVLLDAAVMGLTWPGGDVLDDFPCAVVASRPDVEARIGEASGLPQTGDEEVRRISDDELVGLFEAFPQCLSWR